MPDASTLVGRLRERGVRMTKARQRVLESLCEGPAHLTAEDLAAAVQRRHPDVHLSTIYRALEAFEALGVVRHVHLGHGRATYHLADDLHHHAVCHECGAVLELPPDYLADAEARLAHDHGFVADGHFAISGRCRACVTRAPHT